MEYLGAGGPAVNSPNVAINLAININHNFYMESIKNRTLYYKHFNPTLQTWQIC